MPRYFFDVEDKDGRVPDEVGIELPDMEAAVAEARRALADMAKEMLDAAEDASVTIHIRDGDEGPVHLSLSTRTQKPEG